MDCNMGDMLLNNLFSFTKIIGELITQVINSVDNVTPKMHIGVLHILKMTGPMPISHIGEKMGIAKPNMTQTIDALVAKGWVIRNSSDVDRRVVNIELTSNGSEYIDKTMEQLYGAMVQRFSVLNEEERGKFIDSLSGLIGISGKLVYKK